MSPFGTHMINLHSCLEHMSTFRHGNRSSFSYNLKTKETVMDDDHQRIDGTFSQRKHSCIGGRDVVCSKSRHVGRVSSD